ncbi:hypothetical protein QBC46DRAFT_374391 [Diplogelasinospora grovesii]|uniref:Early meiotic induction protein 1 n=1 Tax=Diplogelasinospora grovesii TaxID=303347 RepID=A0AAN6NI16_9PEZI|nr:hypothetical protein QBC46DRAFT_374391 [Diplogelasinospora grovesii]
MGWFWQQQSTSSSPSSAATTTPAAGTPPQTSTPASTQSTTPPPPPATSSRDDRDPTVDREIQKFWDLLQSDSQSPPPPPTPSTSQSITSSTSTSDPSALSAMKPSRNRTPESIAISESLLPEDMSCRDAFDYAWHCHTPGSQWNAVYRYGTVRSCSELWDDFWFCMRTKSYSPEMRANAIKAHYRAKEEAKYGGGKPSSEDIWESRSEKVQPGTAFQTKFDPPAENEGDKEWQTQELERRRRIRESLASQSGTGRE